MNEAPQLDIVDLGDAKEETKGLLTGPLFEDNPELPCRQIP
jgi:hypothetical protein